MPFLVIFMIIIALLPFGLLLWIPHLTGEVNTPKSARYGILGTTILLIIWLIAFTCTPIEVCKEKIVPVQILQTEDGTIATISYLNIYGNTKLVNLNKEFQRQISVNYKVKITTYKLGPYLGLYYLDTSDDYELVK